MKRPREGARQREREGEKASGREAEEGGRGRIPIGQTMSKNKEEKLIN